MDVFERNPDPRVFDLIKDIHEKSGPNNFLLTLGYAGWDKSQLSNEMKRNICPPDGQIFQTPIVEVMQYTVKEDLQELILHEVKKFTKAVSDSDRKLGYMYFLIGLGTVSQDCKEAHEWLLNI